MHLIPVASHQNHPVRGLHPPKVTVPPLLATRIHAPPSGPSPWIRGAMPSWQTMPSRCRAERCLGAEVDGWTPPPAGLSGEHGSLWQGNTGLTCMKLWLRARFLLVIFLWSRVCQGMPASDSSGPTLERVDPAHCHPCVTGVLGNVLKNPGVRITPVVQRRTYAKMTWR